MKENSCTTYQIQQKSDGCIILLGRAKILSQNVSDTTNRRIHANFPLSSKFT